MLCNPRCKNLYNCIGIFVKQKMQVGYLMDVVDVIIGPFP
jgi:hypothetical protein